MLLAAQLVLRMPLSICFSYLGSLPSSCFFASRAALLQGRFVCSSFPTLFSPVQCDFYFYVLNFYETGVCIRSNHTYSESESDNALLAPSINTRVQKSYQLLWNVARERFELSSAGPKPAMLDHYTTGLHRGEDHSYFQFYGLGSLFS